MVMMAGVVPVKLGLPGSNQLSVTGRVPVNVSACGVVTTIVCGTTIFVLKEYAKERACGATATSAAVRGRASKQAQRRRITSSVARRRPAEKKRAGFDPGPRLELLLYFTDTVTAPTPVEVVWLAMPPTDTTSGRSPERAPVGILTLICIAPATRPGASP